MAWRWRVVNKTAHYESGSVEVGVVYFDSAAPGDLLHNKNFTFSAHESAVELLAEVKAEGAKARRTKEQVDALMATITVDSEGNV